MFIFSENVDASRPLNTQASDDTLNRHVVFVAMELISHSDDRRVTMDMMTRHDDRRVTRATMHQGIYHQQSLGVLVDPDTRGLSHDYDDSQPPAYHAIFPGR